MSFDNRSFLKTQFVPREESVKLASLQKWFGEDEPLWTVRGMTAVEIANAENASEASKIRLSIAEALSRQKEPLTDEAREVLGLTDNTPAIIAKRLEHLVIASVNPMIDITVAIKLAETFPIEFLMLTNKITELTGLGMDIKK